MIDPNSESLISLAEAVKLLPLRRGGKPVHISCACRWSTTGCRGVILESIQIGGTRCTSREALARFFRALTYANHPHDRTPHRRQQAAQAAERELEREGV
jgi:hypothetical protein